MHMRIDEPNRPLNEPIAELIEGKIVGHLLPGELREFRQHSSPKVEQIQ
jgi:hypothetical protein